LSHPAKATTCPTQAPARNTVPYTVAAIRKFFTGHHAGSRTLPAAIERAQADIPPRRVR